MPRWVDDVEQAAIVGLAVYFQQSGADVAQERDPHRFVVHKGPCSSVGRQTPPQDDLAFGGNRLFGQQFVRGIALGWLEHRRGRALRRTGPHGGAAPSAGGQTQGIEKYRFSGAGFTRQDVKTGREFQRRRLDQNDVPDRQRREHRFALSKNLAENSGHP